MEQVSLLIQSKIIFFFWGGQGPPCPRSSTGPELRKERTDASSAEQQPIGRSCQPSCVLFVSTKDADRWPKLPNKHNIS